MKFTDTFVRNLRTEKRMEDKTEGDGFGIRIYATGAKVFYFIYKFDGKRRFLNLGNYDPQFETVTPDSKKMGSLAYHRQKYIEAKNKLHKGIDPLTEKDREKSERKATPTVSDFVKDYIAHIKEVLKSWESVARALNVEVVPRWGKRKISDITDRDIIVLRNEIKERGVSIMANRVLAYISMMFRYAVDEKVIKVSPYINIKRAKKEEPKERALSVSEIKQLWAALDSPDIMMSDEVRRILKLILLTAQRPGEVSGMHWKEIDGNWWTIPAARSKNGRTHRVYLTKTVLDLIGEADGHIFPAGRGGDGSITVNALSFALRRNIKGQSTRTDKEKRRKGAVYKRGPYKSKALPEEPNRIGIDFFTPHDLRRTAATLMATEKVPYETRERVLNHAKEKLDGIYNLHDYDNEKQMALETLERKLISIISIITGTESKVIPIKRKAA